MKKCLFLFVIAAVTLSYGEDKPAVSTQDIKTMEEMGVFAEVEKGEMKAQPGKMQQQGRPGEMRQNMMEMRENVEGLILSRVKAELELTPEQAGKFVENFYKAEEVKKEYMKKKMETLQELRKAATAEKVDEGLLYSLLENYNKLEREQLEKGKEAKDRNLSMLSVKQKAKLVLMEGMMQTPFKAPVRKVLKEEKRTEKKEGKEETK